MDISSNLGLQMSIFIFAVLLGYILAVRIKQPVILGQIIIGLIIGPSLLNIVSDNTIVNVLSQLGAIFLLFVVGLECNIREVYTIKNFVVAFCTVTIPFAVTYAVLRALGYESLVALFVGTALADTSIAIAVEVLRELGKIETSAAKIIIGSAVVDDILGLILLSVTTGIAKSNLSLFSISFKLFVTISFLFLAIACMPLVYRLFTRLDYWAAKTGHDHVIFLTYMAMAFAYSAIAEFIGLSTIVGAFIAGLTIGNLDERKRHFSSYFKTYKEGATTMEILFTSIFFVSLGVLVNLRNMSGVWTIVPILLGIALVVRTFAGWFSSRLLGLSNTQSLIVGVGMAPGGEVTLVVALFGFTLGVITQQMYTAILFVTICTMLYAPFAIKLLYTQRYPQPIKSRAWNRLMKYR